jgi:hypothetical protein
VTAKATAQSAMKSTIPVDCGQIAQPSMKASTKTRRVGTGSIKEHPGMPHPRYGTRTDRQRRQDLGVPGSVAGYQIGDYQIGDYQIGDYQIGLAARNAW